MKSARELMTTKPTVLQSGADITEALKLFSEHEFHYIPVVTPLHEVLGLLSDFALSKACLINYMDPHKANKVISHKALFVDASYVEEDDSLETVMREMSKAPSHRLLVVNKQSKLVGVISPKDILRLLAGAAQRNVDLRDELRKTQDEATKLSDKVETLQNSLNLYQNLFENSPNMMHSVDSDGKILMANEKIHKVLGYEIGELVGQSLSTLYPKTVLHEALSGLAEIKEHGYHHATYTTMQRKNGDKIRIDITSSALRNHKGDFVGTISIPRQVDAEELLRALNGIVTKDKVTAD